MAHIKLSDYHHKERRWGTKTEIDGVELRDVTDIRLHFPVDGIPVLTVTVLIDKGFTYEGEAHVDIKQLDPETGDIVNE